jgi:hypothetical protein
MVKMISASTRVFDKEELLAEESRSKRRRDQRAIGVVYNPEYERYNIFRNG